MATHARQAYLEGEILQADPLQLVRILYRSALDSIAKARQAIREGNIGKRSEGVNMASAILNELALAVDHTKGGEISRNLVELYDYLQRLLQDGNFQHADRPLAEAQDLLAVLADGWEQCAGACEIYRAGGAPVPMMEDASQYVPRSFTC